MSERKPLSKRTRFEIFKRDGFKCLYCGVTPAQKVLRVDHVRPVAEGGSDSATNLVTACFDCNAGKGPVPLDEQRLAVGFASEADLEHAEQIRAWLEMQQAIATAREAVVESLVQLWEHQVGYVPAALRGHLRTAIMREPMEAIRHAISRVGQRELPDVTSQLQYFHGVLRSMRNEAQRG